MKRTVIITGAGGFIGHALGEYLAKDYSVLLVFRSDSFKKEKNKIYLDLSNAQHIGALKKELGTKHIHAVFHTAAPTPFKKAGETYDLETDRSIIQNLSSLANSISLRYFFFLSGWIVYDPHASIPVKESADLKPATEYGVAKLEAEKYLKKNLKKTTLINLRLSSVYGPGQTSFGLIPNLVQTALKGEPLVLNATKTQRDYIYIHDLVSVLCSLLNHAFADHTDLNIGSGQSHSVLSVAERIRDITHTLFGGTVPITTAGRPAESIPPDNRLDIAQVQRIAGIKDNTSFTTGLTHYIRWVRNQKAIFVDLDGTLINAHKRLYKLHADLTQRFNATPVPEKAYREQKRQRIPEGAIMKQTNMSAKDIKSYLTERLQLIEQPDYLRHDVIKNFAKTTLEKLRPQGNLILITSRNNKGNCLHELKSLGIFGCFDEVLITGGRQKKSVIRDFLKEKAYREKIIVGDTEDDLDTALENNMRSVMIGDGMREKEYLLALKPDLFFDTIADISI